MTGSVYDGLGGLHHDDDDDDDGGGDDDDDDDDDDGATTSTTRRRRLGRVRYRYFDASRRARVLLWG